MLRNRDRTDPNYHGKVNRMLYLFLIQANGDAFSEVVFKPLENRVFWGLELLQVFIIFIILTECYLAFLLALNINT